MRWLGNLDEAGVDDGSNIPWKHSCVVERTQAVSPFHLIHNERQMFEQWLAVVAKCAVRHAQDLSHLPCSRRDMDVHERREEILACPTEHHAPALKPTPCILVKDVLYNKIMVSRNSVGVPVVYIVPETPNDMHAARELESGVESGVEWEGQRSALHRNAGAAL